jgi:anti-sigma B factor antagonist
MKYSTEQLGSVTVVTLQGSLMGGPDAAALNARINELVDARKTRVVIDLSGVQFMNSSGLGLLIGGAHALKSAGGGLKIAGASPKIVELFTITRLTSILENHPTVAEAVAAFGA